MRDILTSYRLQLTRDEAPTDGFIKVATKLMTKLGLTTVDPISLPDRILIYDSCYFYDESSSKTRFTIRLQSQAGTFQ